MKILVKNMVCERCKTILKQELEASGMSINAIELGEIDIQAAQAADMRTIENIIIENGFEMVKDNTDLLVENIKAQLLQLANEPKNVALSSFLSNKLHKDYSVLSKVFSKHQGITIEKYFINLKIEKVKELIQLGRLNFLEIAYQLNYKNSSHLAQQFKAITGMSMSTYKDLKNWNRKPLDQIL
ncbi:helix-turn-helix domain-containing protein [Galbibacter sp. PAP.153]|uniref:helix-turn-helix domain-containing protein n=1 Tax=Galbibacter sp. PAP.153 TaxID=3104623 RepID=UPI00300A54A8